MSERDSGSQYSAFYARAVLRDLSLPWSTVRKILKSSLKWYPYKINFEKQLNPAESGKRHNFVTNFLARIFVNIEWPWNILWSKEAHFTLDGAVKRQIFRIWGSVSSLLCMSVIWIRIIFMYGVVLQLIFILGSFFFEQNTSQSPQRCSITKSRYCCLLLHCFGLTLETKVLFQGVFGLHWLLILWT